MSWNWNTDRGLDDLVRWGAFLLSLWAVGAATALADTNPSPRTTSTTPPLIVLWDTAHTGTNPSPASHSLLRGDQAATTFVLKAGGDVTTAELSAVNLYALIEPDTRHLSASEICAIRNFMARGGNFLLLSDTDADSAGINALLAGSGITQADNFTGGFESTNELTSHSVTAGVRSFFVASGGRSFSTTSPALSCVRYHGQTIVAAADLGARRIVVIGDETSLQDNGTPPNYSRDDNPILTRNVFNWFRRRGAPGRISLDAAVYSCTGTAALELTDADLTGATTASLEAGSSRGDRETIVLAGPGLGRFAGSITLTAGPVVPGDGRLSVSDGSTIIVTYHDADNGSGESADVQTSAVVDGRPPAIRQVQVSRVGPFSAWVSWTTDEPATARVRFGLSRSATTQTVERLDLRTSHALELRWLRPETRYFFVVESSDAVGNLAIADGGAPGFTFTTGRSRRASPLIRVLLLYGDSSMARVSAIAAKLLADGRIAFVGLWDYDSVLPNLTALRGYDAVLIHANRTSPNQSALGDVLADYIESGGPVVSLNRTTVEPQAIGGRFRTRAYGVCVASASYRTDQRTTLGTIRLPAHPLMDGVARFDGGAWSGHQSSVVLATDSVRVADWTDSEPLVAYRLAGDTRLVGLNFFGPPSSPTNPELWDSSTDGGPLMVNALVWSSRALESDPWTTPTLLPEPAFTRGTSNTVSWSDFPQATGVEIEWSRDAFATVAGRTGWIAQSLHQRTISGLAGGQTYGYRMRGRNVAFGYSPLSGIVSSTQDSSPPHSTITLLPPITRTSSVMLRLSGDDGPNGSGIQSADLFWRRGSAGPFVGLARFNTLPQSYSFAFSGRGGPGQYEFLVRATDRVGNVELKSPADTRTTVDWGKTAARRWFLYDR